MEGAHNVDTLERILSAKRLEDNADRLLADLVADVAAAGGVALIDDLIRQGHPRAVIAAAIEPEGGDKRTRPLLRCSVVNGVELVWVTTKGWAQAGQPNRRESPPGSRTARHRTAPALLDRWIRAMTPLLLEQDVLLTLDRGPGLRAACEEMTQRAWGLIRQGGSTGQDAALLLTRPVPDALLVESWPAKDELIAWRDSSLYPHLGSEDRPESEMAVAVEIQYADSGTALLSQRLRAHDIAMRLGRGWHATLWVVDSLEVLVRLNRAGVFDTTKHPGHYVIEARDVGLGDHPPLNASNWSWPRVEQHWRGRH